MSGKYSTEWAQDIWSRLPEPLRKDLWKPYRLQDLPQPSLEEITDFRRYLTRTDECIKAYHFIQSASSLYPVKDQVKIVEKQIEHILDEKVYEKWYTESEGETFRPDGPLFNYSTYPERFHWVKLGLGYIGAKKVLDLGCGDGAPDYILAKLGYEVTGINLHQVGVELANDRVKRLGGVKAQFKAGNFLKMKFNPEYDAVLCFEVIEHVADPKKMLEVAWSAVRPGGLLFISTPDGTADEVGSSGDPDATDRRGHVRVYTEKSLREELKDYPVAEFYRSAVEPVKILHFALRKPDEKA